MSEYWKSQPRKFCEYCKCWITDNKPSVDFHEKGKKHQENVKRKIDEVRKKGITDAKKQEKLEDDLEKMEKAALEAFKKDLASDPELAAKYGVRVRSEAEKEAEKTKKETAADIARQKALENVERKQREGEWYEAKSSEGYTYYWNTVTHESKWVAPKVYVSLEEQEAKKMEEEEETKKQARVQEELDALPDQVTVGPLLRGTTSTTAYGRWTTVQELPNLDLPEDPPIPLEPLPVEDIPLPEPPKEKVEKKQEGGRFKEKRVKSLASDNDTTKVTFKKRKLGSGARNTRQREDED
ncbi:WW domain-binding protein 4-like [Ostrea edulis]|uniref:WW domain-binding protein 4-like n=1 Tax=Ostrea edulis TaxID=37623 RepID=UPI002095C89B|nr:WW domain-binding protein 4-like [Ostrea edulis]